MTSSIGEFKQKLKFHLPIWCDVEQDEDGVWVATIEDVDDLEGRGDSAQAATHDLAINAYLGLRGWFN